MRYLIEGHVADAVTTLTQSLHSYNDTWAGMMIAILCDAGGDTERATKRSTP